MLLSAVSFGFLLLLDDQQQLQKREAVAWDKAKSSVAILLRNGQPYSEAALINKSGLFIANQSAVSTPTLQARLDDGRVIELTWRSTDTPTQTVLLQATDWQPENGAEITLRPPGENLAKVPVIVVLPTGPVRGELISSSRVGVLSSSHRMFPLGEVRFEKTTDPVAGALVFDDGGHLVGLLNATLESEEPVQTQRIKAPQNDIVTKTMLNQFRNNQTGPADMTVGYTVGPEILRRVVSGFLSPTHKVQHPAIGLICINAPDGGALIQEVKPNSPAEKAGIKVGDTIIKMDDQQVKNQFDFARIIESKDVGESVTVTVSRELMPITFKLTVGTVQKALRDAASPVIG